MSAFLLSAGTLWQREIVRFVRQRSRIIGALGQPLLFWLLLGSGFGESFRSGGAATGGGYLEYFYPGILAMVILFTAIFATIAVVEDRKERFLQAVLVSPAPRSAIVLGQALGSTTLALIQGFILLGAAPFAGVPITAGSAIGAAAVMCLIGFMLSSLGLAFAWRMDSTQGFHSVMNLVLLPLWLLSGAVFPAMSAHPILDWLMKINPLSYGVSALRRTLYAAEPGAWAHLPELGPSLAITALFGFIFFMVAVRHAGQSEG
ncbi:MAG: ABC transporter permease [Nitrospinaceae bacterium]|jgi:ABC-2 type transport system permease protein|nr:ABC transporter permease [Nitrospinaceae bacterium]MBT3434681.1 ABC transporter permease [Nitrospinaceae bacterium]MBT3821357.1 ABC transporter permease [Nitrospinaceae bacterium]MBT4095931.1 ABC transporter permease [Nitrospinaceae bacterium]MBT4430091.1 ABC transporter permease [Nitrospinaceae bacterium]